MTKKWWVYILRCNDGTLYTGVTTDMERRVKEHNGEMGGEKGAKYTKMRRPVTLVYKEKVLDRSAAQAREAEIKKLSKERKSALVDK